MDPGFVSLQQLNAAMQQLIQCGKCLIVFEPRYMMYRFVSQFVALQFFFCSVSLRLGICTSSWTQTWIYVCSWVRGHTCGSQRTIYGAQFSPFTIDNKLLSPLSHPTSPHPISSKLNYFLINVKIMSSIVSWVDSLFRNMANHYYTFPWWILVCTGLS